MNAVATFGVLVIGVLVELWAMPLEQQQRSADTVSWYDLYPASAVQKEDPVYYKNEANSIWSDCSKTTDPLKISYVEIYPSSPTRGQLFTVHAKAQLSQNVTGGIVKVSIKYMSIIPVVNKQFQLCNLAISVLKTCPLEAGVHEATLTEFLPSYAPSGRYTGSIVATDNNGNELACVSINVSI